jgi:TRL-like protein family
MKLFGKFAGVVSLCAALSGCATTYTPVLNNTQLNQIDFSRIASKKTGSDCVNWYFIFGPFGTMSIGNAAKNGGLKKVEFVDNSYSSGFFKTSNCLVAYGE